MTELVKELKRITGASTNCGWMCDEVADFLAAMVRFYKPELVIQTGHLWGKSAAMILSADGTGSGGPRDEVEGDEGFRKFLEDHTPGNGRPASLISIDPDPMGVTNHAAGLNLLLNEFGSRFRFVKSKSADFFTLVKIDARIMGLVDGDHTDAGCRKDIESLAAMGAEVILVDDTLWLPSLKHVAKEAAARLGYSFQNHAIYNGIAVLVKE